MNKIAILLQLSMIRVLRPMFLCMILTGLLTACQNLIIPYGSSGTNLTDTQADRSNQIEKRMRIAIADAERLAPTSSGSPSLPQLRRALNRLRTEPTLLQDKSALTDAIAQYEQLYDSRQQDRVALLDQARSAFLTDDPTQGWALLAQAHYIDPENPETANIGQSLITDLFKRALYQAQIAHDPAELARLTALQRQLQTRLPNHQSHADLAATLSRSTHRFFLHSLSQARKTQSYFSVYQTVMDLALEDRHKDSLALLRRDGSDYYQHQAIAWQDAGDPARAFIELYKAQTLTPDDQELSRSILTLQDNLDRKLHHSIAIFRFAAPAPLNDWLAKALLIRLRGDLGYGFRLIDQTSHDYHATDMTPRIGDYNIIGKWPAHENSGTAQVTMIRRSASYVRSYPTYNTHTHDAAASPTHLQNFVDQIADDIRSHLDMRENEFFTQTHIYFAQNALSDAHESLAQGLLFCDRRGRFGAQTACDDLMALMLAKTESKPTPLPKS